jgi:hypothetical protein
MKTFIKLALAGAALAGGAAAQAQIPTSGFPTAAGGSDLILFVTDTTTGASFVQDLGVNLDSLGVTTASVVNDSNCGAACTYSLFGTGGTGPLGSGNPITVGAGIITSGGVDTALATWEAGNASTDTLYYSIIGAAQGNGSNDPGQGRFGATYTSANGANIFGSEQSTSAVVGAASSTNGFFGDVNGKVSYFAATAGSGNLAMGSFMGTNNGASLGGTTFFYELAGFGGSNDANVYASTDAITVGAKGAITGLVSAAGAVPLPAAFWLLGSGVLGLFGISRRRAAPAA